VALSDYPFLIDSSAPEVRAFGVKYATEIGVADRAIHNSINASITDEELAAVKESDLDAAIVLAFNAMEKGTKGKMDILTKAAGGAKKGMLEYAKECGITRPLIDTAAMPLGADPVPHIVPALQSRLSLACQWAEASTMVHLPGTG